MTGALVLVAGPSGAGKDTLLRLARRQLGDDPRFVFVKRVITRPTDTGSEDHQPASIVMFEQLTKANAFALSWEAHGLRYGVPRSIMADLAMGRVVIVNVSRRMIAEAARRFSNCSVVMVTAPVEHLAARLAARGREPKEALSDRLLRCDVAPPPDLPVTMIHNDGTPEEGAQLLVTALQRWLAPATPRLSA